MGLIFKIFLKLRIQFLFFAPGFKNMESPLPLRHEFSKTELIFTMEEKKNNDPHQLNIELSEEMAEGIYANLAIITHSNAEFVVDFVNVMPGIPKAKVKSRIILTPQHAKRFMKALTDNIKKYESMNGPIQDQEPVNIPMNFGGPAAQA
jgi:hypothetical protein